MTEPNTNPQRPLRIILPDQKRLKEAFADIVTRADFQQELSGDRVAKSLFVDKRGELPPLEAYQLRSDAALEWIADGNADIAIVGLDTLNEFNAGAKNESGMFRPVPILRMSDVSACSLWLAARPEVKIEEFKDLSGLRIATSYPSLLQQLLEKEQVKASRIIAQKGGVEAAIVAGRADAILEVVETGKSLAVNGLEKKLRVLQSSAAMVRTSRLYGTEKEDVISKVTARIDSVAKAQKFLPLVMG